MSTYNTVAGLVQFDVSERKAGEQTVRDVVIQALGSGGSNVKITIWPEFSKVKIEKGDFVVAQGKFETQTVNGTVYHQLSANGLNINGKPFLKAAPVAKATPAQVEEDEQELLF